jgi:hypothetical protein
MGTFTRLTTMLTVAGAAWAIAAGAYTEPNASALQARGRSSRSPADSQACTLLTKEDAAAALGESVNGPDAASGPSSMAAGTTASSCEYMGSGLHKVNLNVMSMDAATAAVYKGLCAQKGKEGLSGLGEVACWYSPKHEELQVLKGGTFFSVELRRSGDPTEAIKSVARKVFDRLR